MIGAGKMSAIEAAAQATRQGTVGENVEHAFRLADAMSVAWKRLRASGIEGEQAHAVMDFLRTKFQQRSPNAARLDSTVNTFLSDLRVKQSLSQFEGWVAQARARGAVKADALNAAGQTLRETISRATGLKPTAATILERAAFTTEQALEKGAHFIARGGDLFRQARQYARQGAGAATAAAAAAKPIVVTGAKRAVGALATVKGAAVGAAVGAWALAGASYIGYTEHGIDFYEEASTFWGEELANIW